VNVARAFHNDESAEQQCCISVDCDPPVAILLCSLGLAVEDLTVALLLYELLAPGASGEQADGPSPSTPNCLLNSSSGH
jgi:hypothetical protein